MGRKHLTTDGNYLTERPGCNLLGYNTSSPCLIGSNDNFSSMTFVGMGISSFMLMSVMSSYCMMIFLVIVTCLMIVFSFMVMTGMKFMFMPVMIVAIMIVAVVLMTSTGHHA